MENSTDQVMNITLSYNAMPPVGRYTQMVLGSFCAFFGTFANGWIFVAIIKYKKLHLVPNIFVGNMCINDMLFSCLYLPSAVVVSNIGYWPLGEFSCEVAGYILYTLLGSSIMALVGVTLNRYIMIVHVKYYHTMYTMKKSFLYIIVKFVFVFLVLLPPLFKLKGGFGWSSRTFGCVLLKQETGWYRNVVYGLSLVLPILTMAVAYVHIFLTVRLSRKKIQIHTDPKEQDVQKGREKKHKASAESKVTKMAATVFTVFMICTVPFSVYNIIDKDAKYQSLYMVLTAFGWLPVSINPMIYAASNKQIQVACLALVGISLKTTHVITHSNTTKGTLM